MTELVESPVRKHCAMWETGAGPGAFALSPAAPLALFPLTGVSGALEIVARFTGTPGVNANYLALRQSAPDVSFVVGETVAGLEIYYHSNPPGVAITCVWPGPVALTWYHVLGVLVNDGADNMRLELYVNGALTAQTGAAVALTPFGGGDTTTWNIGHSGGRDCLGDIALVRDWVGSWPTESELPDVPWYPPATAGLEGQWDFRPGNGDTIYDSGGGGFDMPWVAGTQAHASYAHYQFTGQPRGQLWQPR